MSDAVALVDCNSFYCSCERVFDPKIWNRPVAVLSNNDGCIVSRTTEVKALGVPMGAPYHQYKDILTKHNAAVFSSNYTLYGDISNRVMQTLRDFSPEMEIYSIDEAFLSFKGFRNIEAHSKKLKDTVMKNVGIPVSVGIGPTKVLAKVANHVGKKQGKACNLMHEKSHEKILSNFYVGDVWGVGRKSLAKLLSHNIRSAWDLRNANEKFIQRLMTIQGRRIVRELRGEACIELENIAKAKKNIATTRSFGKPVHSLDQLKEAVACHATTCMEKLRKQDGLCSTVLVFIHTNPHKNTWQYSNSGTMNLLSGTSYTPKLINAAFQILEKIYKPNIEYKKCGVIISNFSRKSEGQMDLFSENDSGKEDALMRAKDAVNNWHGSWTLKPAACGIHKDWKMLSKMRTPCWTTRWSDLLEV